MNLKNFTFLAISGLALTACSQEPDIHVFNDSNQPMTGFYASTDSSRQWEENIIASESLKAHDWYNIGLDDGRGDCVLDLKTVFADGHSREYYGVNVCRTIRIRAR